MILEWLPLKCGYDYPTWNFKLLIFIGLTNTYIIITISQILLYVLYKYQLIITYEVGIIIFFYFTKQEVLKHRGRG